MSAASRVSAASQVGSSVDPAVSGPSATGTSIATESSPDEERPQSVECADRILAVTGPPNKHEDEHENEINRRRQNYGCYARNFHVSTLGDALRGLKLLFPLTRKNHFFPLTSG